MPSSVWRCIQTRLLKLSIWIVSTPMMSMGVSLTVAAGRIDKFDRVVKFY
jgi:hypothetical protein